MRKLLSLIALLLPLAVLAQPKPNDAGLRRHILALDSALYAAFDACDATAFGNLLADDIEWYDEDDGPLKGKARVLAFYRSTICPSTNGKPARKAILQRQLDKASVVVRPMPNFGALQLGRHKLYLRTPKGPKLRYDMAFTHLWEQKDGQWRLSRVLLYRTPHK